MTETKPAAKSRSIWGALFIMVAELDPILAAHLDSVPHLPDALRVVLVVGGLGLAVVGRWRANKPLRLT